MPGHGFLEVTALSPKLKQQAYPASTSPGHQEHRVHDQSPWPLYVVIPGVTHGAYPGSGNSVFYTATHS